MNGGSWKLSAVQQLEKWYFWGHTTCYEHIVSHNICCRGAQFGLWGSFLLHCFSTFIAISMIKYILPGALTRSCRASAWKEINWSQHDTPYNLLHWKSDRQIHLHRYEWWDVVYAGAGLRYREAATTSHLHLICWTSSRKNEWKNVSEVQLQSELMTNVVLIFAHDGKFQGNQSIG